MSEKEIKEIKRNLPKWQDRTEEDKLMYEEMNLRSMIMSLNFVTHLSKNSRKINYCF